MPLNAQDFAIKASLHQQRREQASGITMRTKIEGVKLLLQQFDDVNA